MVLCAHRTFVTSDAECSGAKFSLDVLRGDTEVLRGFPARSAALAFGVHVHTVLPVCATKLELVPLSATVTTEAPLTVAMDMVAGTPTIGPLAM
jgi:hypothetical protein